MLADLVGDLADEFDRRRVGADGKAEPANVPYECLRLCCCRDAQEEPECVGERIVTREGLEMRLSRDDRRTRDTSCVRRIGFEQVNDFAPASSLRQAPETKMAH